MPGISEVCPHQNNPTESSSVAKPALRVGTAMLVFSSNSKGNPIDVSFPVYYIVVIQCGDPVLCLCSEKSHGGFSGRESRWKLQNWTLFLLVQVHICDL